MCLMKKLMRTFALMAVAALGLSACTGEKLVPDNGNADGKFVTVHFGAEAAIEGATKATLTPNEAETMFASAWETTDVISVKYLSPNGTEKIVPATWKGESFEAVGLPNEHGEWYYQACYPKPDEKDSHIDFGGARIQDGNKYNSAYDVMICELFSEANADAGKTADGKDVVFNMDRKTGIAYFHLTGGPADEEVVSATLSVEGGFIASQYAYISDFAFAPTKDLTEITITYKEGTAPMASDFKLWFNVLPTEYTKMTLTVETANHTLTISRAKADNYAAGKLYKVVKNIPVDKWVKKVTNNNYVLHEGELVEGDYLIVYEGKAMKASVTKDRLDYVDVTDKVKGKRIENSDGLIIWHIAPSAEYWTIFNDKTKSFAASTGAKNKAQLLAEGADDMSLWTVTKTTDDSTFEFVNKANSSANPAVNANLRNNGTYGFACYATTIGGPLSLYRLDGPVDNTIPSLSVDQTSKVWAADATDAFVVNVTVNSEGGDWTVTPEILSWATIAVDKTAGTITVTPNGANTAQTANEATLTVAHVSDASLKAEITLKQNPAGVAVTKTYTLTFAGTYGDENVGVYTSTWDATRDGFTWTMAKWNNNKYNNSWTYVKAGPKGNTNAHAMISTKSAMPEAISKISITIDIVENGSITSIVLKSSSTNDFTAGTVIETKSSVGQGEVVFEIPSPQNGLYYQLDFTLNNTTPNSKKGKNGVVQVSKVVYTNN